MTRSIAKLLRRLAEWIEPSKPKVTCTPYYDKAAYLVEINDEPFSTISWKYGVKND